MVVLKCLIGYECFEKPLVGMLKSGRLLLVRAVGEIYWNVKDLSEFTLGFFFALSVVITVFFFFWSRLLH